MDAGYFIFLDENLLINYNDYYDEYKNYYKNINIEDFIEVKILLFLFLMSSFLSLCVCSFYPRTQNYKLINVQEEEIKN